MPALVDALAGEDLQAQTRRSAAIALGVMLREGVASSKLRWKAVRALRSALDTDKDNLVRGFAAMALGGAKEPVGVEVPPRHHHLRQREAAGAFEHVGDGIHP